MPSVSGLCAMPRWYVMTHRAQCVAGRGVNMKNSATATGNRPGRYSRGTRVSLLGGPLYRADDSENESSDPFICGSSSVAWQWSWSVVRVPPSPPTTDRLTTDNYVP